MQKARFYVGSNNTTHELERDKIEQVMAKRFEGFSAFEIVGYWKGSKEKTLLIEVITLENKGLIMPEDWETLSEDDKQSRLNNVINELL